MEAPLLSQARLVRLIPGVTVSYPHLLLTSGGLGTMGYGLGAAIGAKMGCRDKTVINIAGDGCFRMNMNEIATATRYRQHFPPEDYSDN